MITKGGASGFQSIERVYNNGGFPALEPNLGPREHQIFLLTGAVRYAFSMLAVFTSRPFKAVRVRAIYTDLWEGSSY